MQKMFSGSCRGEPASSDRHYDILEEPQSVPRSSQLLACKEHHGSHREVSATINISCVSRYTHISSPHDIRVVGGRIKLYFVDWAAFSRFNAEYFCRTHLVPSVSRACATDRPMERAYFGKIDKEFKAPEYSQTGKQHGPPSDIYTFG